MSKPPLGRSGGGSLVSLRYGLAPGSKKEDERKYDEYDKRAEAGQ